MPRFTITEPHPSVAQNSYIHAGRGGAGNFMRAPLTTAPAGVPTPLYQTTSASSTASSRSFYSGRGGAGNAHSAIDRPVLSFEDEYRQRVASPSPRGQLVGRGGAGNFAATADAAAVGSSGGKRRTSSSSSAGSVASSAGGGSESWRNRLSGTFRN